MITEFKDKNGKTIYVGDVLCTDKYKIVGEVTYIESEDKYFLEGINYIIPLEKIDTRKYNVDNNFCLVKVETFFNKFSVENKEFWNRSSLKKFLRGLKARGFTEDDKMIYYKDDREIFLEVKFNRYIILE